MSLFFVKKICLYLLLYAIKNHPLFNEQRVAKGEEDAENLELSCVPNNPFKTATISSANHGILAKSNKLTQELRISYIKTF